MSFGTWNVKRLYKSGSSTAATRELATYKLEFGGVQEGRWEEEGIARSGDYNFFNGRGNDNDQLGTGHLYITE